MGAREYSQIFPSQVPAFPPVFLHCGWRTAGTWIWSQFRKKADVCAFYEPLNESLATLTLRSLHTMRPGVSNSRHPEPDRPYFEEFAPLLAPRRPGAIGFRPEFAYDTFFLSTNCEAPELASYIESLIALAESQAKIPVFKFCRSLGRVGWLRSHFPGASHIVVLRDPASQWLSAWKIFQEDGNPYFILTPLQTLVRHWKRETVAGVVDALRLNPGDYDFPRKHAASCNALRATAPRLLYRAFLAFWLCTTFTAISEADVIVESERLSSPKYRLIAEKAIEEHSGIAVDLSDARVLHRSMPANDPFDSARAHREAAEAMAVLEPSADETSLGAIRLLRDKLSQTSELPLAI